MKKNIARFAKSDFIKSIGTLVSGSILAQVVTLLCSPILTRLYSTSDFGVFTFVISIVAIFSTIINGRYDVSIVNSRSNEVYPLIRLNIIICLSISLVVSIGCYGYFKIDGYSGSILLSLIVLALLIISGIVNILNAVNNRYRDFKLMTSVYLIRSVAQNALMLFFAFFKFGSWGLLISQFLGQLLGIKKQSKNISIKHVFRLSKFSLSRIKYVANKYKQQFFLSAPASFLNALSYSLISIIIGMSYGMAVLGIYSISVRLLGLPLNVFSSNIAKVHFSDSTVEIKNKNNYYQSTKKTLLLAVGIVIPIMAILFIGGESLCSWIFGKDWSEAGVYLKIFIPMFTMRFLVGAVGFAFVLSSKQKVEFVFQLLFIVTLVLISIMVSILNLNVYYFLSLISIVYSLLYIAELFIIIRSSKKL